MAQQLYLNMHTLPPSGFNSSMQFPAEGLQVYCSSPGKLCWLNSEVKEFPPTAQLKSVRTMMLCRRDANKIWEISLGFLEQFMLFLLERHYVLVSK